jgi:hypothetical protein
MTSARSLAESISRDVEALAKRDTQSLRSLRREYSKQLRDVEGSVVIGAALELWQRRQMHRFIGDELIANHRGARKRCSAS